MSITARFYRRDVFSQDDNGSGFESRLRELEKEKEIETENYSLRIKKIVTNMRMRLRMIVMKEKRN